MGLRWWSVLLRVFGILMSVAVGLGVTGSRSVIGVGRRMCLLGFGRLSGDCGVVCGAAGSSGGDGGVVGVCGWGVVGGVQAAVSGWWLREFRGRYVRDEIDLPEFERLVEGELRDPHADPAGCYAGSSGASLTSSDWGWLFAGVVMMVAALVLGLVVLFVM